MSTGPFETLAIELAKLKSLGHTAIAREALIPYVDGLARSACAADPEGERQRIELNFEGQLEAYKAQVGAQLEMFKAVMETGQSALRALSVENGAPY